ncbi:MAG TPA: hypothetical protein VKR61_11260 [Bryobacteraceae bacterium]|nr:hypothetical protein [Bryobacteraceae bacterium]
MEPSQAGTLYGIEEMALKADEWKAINARIDRVIGESIEKALDPIRQQFKPSRRWKRVFQFLRDWSLLGTNIAAIIALLAMAAAAWYFALSRLEKETRFQTHTEDRLTAIEALLAPQKIKQAADTPSRPDSKTAIIQALEKSKKTEITIPVQVIADASLKFILASKTDQTDWPIALDLVNYRSYLNTFSTPIPSGMPTPNWQTHYHLQVIPPDRKDPEFEILMGVAVQKESGAILEPLGPQPPNAENPIGNPVLIGKGGYMNLDGMHLRHVILNGVEIHYSGTALLMEDVIFINCTFAMDNTESSRALARVIATESNVKFSSA